MRNAVVLSGLALLAAAGSAQAEWKGKGEAGLVFARGNSDTNNINFKLGMTEEVDQWKHSLDMAMLYVTADGLATANRYSAAWQSDYKFNPATFVFGGVRYDKDHFSGFNYQASATAGVGHNFADSDQLKFSAQAGVGYRRIENDGDAVNPNATSGDAIFTAGLNYENKLTDTTKVLDKFTLETGKDDTLLANFIGVEVKMSTALALSVGLDTHYNTSPPAQLPPAAPLKKLDTLTTVNLVYSF